MGFKLNIDGRTDNHQCTGGGGIIRDTQGHFIGAFTFFLDNIAISIPELESLHFAASVCKAKTCEIKEIETTSQRLINIMTAKEAPPWALTYKFRKIKA